MNLYEPKLNPLTTKNKTQKAQQKKKKLINNIKSKNTLNPTKKSKQRTKLEKCTSNEQQEDGVLLGLERSRK